MAIAEHNPSKLYAKNKGMLSMSKNQLHDFAATPRKGLPKSASHSEPDADDKPGYKGPPDSDADDKMPKRKKSKSWFPKKGMYGK